MALQVWLPLNGTLENKGLSNVTITANGTTSYAAGKIGQGLNCNGSSNWRVANVTIGTTCSICWWAKTATDGKMPWVLEANVYTSLNFYYTNNYYCLNIGDGNKNPFINDSGTNISSLKDNVWHHFAVVFDGSKCSLYIDGEYKGKAKTYKSPTTSNKKFRVGGDFNNGHTYDFNGMLNDVRLYDHALSEKEVKEISKGLILHYKLDGNDIGITIPRNGGLIPDGVELYDYILSSGTLWINTGVNGYMNHRYELDYQQTGTGSYRMWGVFGLASYVGYNMSITYASGRCVRWSSTSSGQTLVDSIDTISNTTRHTFIINNGLVYYDGVDKGKSSGHSDSCVINYPVYLFTVNPANTTPTANAVARVYSYKDYDTSGTLIRNMLPCTYLGEPGMWDTVENKFYRNQGTGLFTLGNKITLKEYEYLESTGTLYIDSGIIPLNNPKLEFTWASTLAIDKHHVGNNRTNSGTIIFGRDATRFYYRYYSTALYYINETPVINKFYNIVLDNKLTIDGVVKHTNSNVFSAHNNTSLKIFGSDNAKGECKIKTFKIYENNQLVRDFIPVSYNGTPGLWDKVEWKFYANAGTGSFTLGPEIAVQQNTPVFYDSSGYCNHGSITGTLTTNSDTPRYTNSIQFGSNKLISTTASGPYILTMSIWAKDAGSTPTDGLMFKDHLGDMALGIQSNILYSGKSGGHGAGSTNISNVNYTVNTWHHWVMVNRDNTYYVYMDGQQVLSGTSGNWGAGTVTNALHIGGRSGSSPWPGKLSDFRAYATALSEDDIKELYNTSAFVTNNGVFAEYELYEDNLSDVKKTGLLETANFYENGAESGYALDTDKTRVASNYIISEEFIEI